MKRRRRPEPLQEALAVLMVAAGLVSAFVGCGDSETTVAGKARTFGQVFGSLEGRAFDRVSGAALSGVEVRLEAGQRVFTAVTGPDGLYRLPGLPAGSYALRARRATHQLLRRALTVTQGVAEQADLGLEPILDQGAAELTVVDSLSGVPLAGVDVTALFLGRRGLTDPGGQVLFAALPVGSTQFLLQLPGYQVRSASVEVRAGELTTPTIRLLRNSGTITGTVRSTPAMAPLTGALVSLPGLGIQTATNAAGGYTLLDVPEDAFTDVLFTEPSHSPVFVTTGVARGRVTTLDVVMTFGFGEVEGVVRTLMGPPIAGATVSIPQFQLTTVTGGGGAYRFPRVPADTSVAIGAFAAGHSPLTTQIPVPPNGFVIQDFDLIPTNGGLSGVVRRASDMTPVANALVQIPLLGASTSTDAFGAYSLGGILAQFHVVRFQAAGLSTLSTSVLIRPGLTTNLDVEMLEPPPPPVLGTLQGTVRSSGDNSPIGSALVSLPALGRSVFTNGAGAYTFLDVPAGTGLPLFLQAAGFTDLSTSVDTTGGIDVADFLLGPL